MTERATVEELAGTWALLERPGSTLFRAARTCLRLGDREVQVAVDRVGARHLLVPHFDAPDENAVWRNRTMNLSRSTLADDDGRTATWLMLKCKRTDVEEAFVRLCAQIVRKVTDSPHGTIAERCIAVLEEWQELFGGIGAAEESLTGVIGELLLLLRLARVDPRGAWQAWEGPRGGRHDFRRAATAVEVKSTLRATARIVTVNGLTQLVAPQGGTLHLLFTRLERVPGGSITLASLVSQLVALGISRSDLLEILEDLGHSPDQQSTAFEERETCLYAVNNTFPRIVQGSFAGGAAPVGVSNVTYSVDLDHTTALPSADVEPLTRLLATG